ncbi:MAG: tetratricopeptide repeat protein [Lewinellaceae bacterium]|nr:tetratricopeptide repeat protein [Lewinellaceae bacterium]
MRKNFSCTLLLTCFCTTLWCQPSRLQEAAQYQNRAAAQLLNGDLEGAIRELEMAASVYKEAEEWEHYFSCLNQATNAYLSSGKLDEAKRTAKKALWESIQRLGRDNDEAAKAAHRLAEVYSRANRHEKAIEVHKMGLMIRESIYGTEHIKLAGSYDWMAKAWSAAGDYEQAAHFYERAMSLRKTLLGSQHPDVAISYTNLASLELSNGNYRQALTHFQTAYNIIRNHLGKNHPEAASALAAMARVNRLLGEKGLSGRQYREAAYIFQQNPDERGGLVAEAFHELAIQLFDRGEIGAAADYARKAIQALAFDPGKNQQRFSGYYQLLGAILMELGQYEEAASSFQHALSSKKGVSAANYLEWSEALRRSGNRKAALEAARMFMKWAERQEGPYALLNARAQQGRLLIENGQTEEGAEQLARVLNHPETPFWLAQEATFSLAAAYRQKGEYEQAIELYKQLASEWEHTHQPTTVFLHFKAMLAMGSIHCELAGQDRNTLYNLEAALNSFRTCDKTLSGLVRSPLPSGQAVFLSEACLQLYNKAIAACYSIYEQNQEGAYLEEAFYFSERSKQFSQQLPLLMLPPISFARVPASLQEKESECRMEAQSLYRELKNSRFYEGPIDSLTSKIEKERTEYEAILDKLKEEAPACYRLRFGGETVSLEELKMALRARPAVLYSYYMDEENLYVFHFTGEEFQLFRWPLDEEFHSSLLEFIQMVYEGPGSGEFASGPTFRQITGLATLLYQKLLPGLSPQEGGRLLLLPHGLIQWLPFEALLPSVGKGSDFTTLPYLGLSHSIYYHTSATALLQALDDAPSASWQSPFEAFVQATAGNPVVLKENKGPYPDKQPELGYFLGPARNWAGRQDGRLWEGPMAREAVFRELPGPEVLLLALPTQVGASPEDTFLSFADKPDSLYDNRLYLREVYGIDKPVSLSILASSSPRSPESSNWQHLAEALHYSGSRSALFHRWPATGQPSADLLQFFLSGYKSTGNGPGALQEARRKYLDGLAARPELAHPHFWAGYAFYGTEEDVGSPSGIPPLWIIASVAGLILIGWLVRLN